MNISLRLIISLKGSAQVKYPLITFYGCHYGALEMPIFIITSQLIGRNLLTNRSHSKMKLAGRDLLIRTNDRKTKIKAQINQKKTNNSQQKVIYPFFL